MQLFCLFVRHPTKDEEHEEPFGVKFGLATPFIRADVKAVMDMIAQRDETRIALETAVSYQPDFSNAKLKNLRIFWGDLSNALLMNTDMSNSVLVGTDLSGAILGGANLSKTDITEAILSGAFLGVIQFNNIDPRVSRLLH